MIQPNVYWTLVTPLANFIGLYSNVPKFGYVSDEQKAWFVNELREADRQKGKALIVCIHHAPYSADSNHGSSRNMITFLENAFEEAGVLPDIVFSGHVHNYQRFSKKYPSGKEVPFIVAGAGGYVTLFPLVPPTQVGFTGDDSLLNDVSLVNYCDDHYGFLKIAIEKQQDGLTLTGEYYTIANEAAMPTPGHMPLFEKFTIPIVR
jgi:3',5'-cyclic AMP phosphodiesterase CpdA